MANNGEMYESLNFISFVDLLFNQLAGKYLNGIKEQYITTLFYNLFLNLNKTKKVYIEFDTFSMKLDYLIKQYLLTPLN